MEKNLFEIYRTPQLQNPSLIIGWQTRDIGKIGSGITRFLNEKLGGIEVAEIKPLGFFPLGGAVFKDDLLQVPASKFWACQKNDLLIFRSNEPKYEWYKFLNAVLDFAEEHCKAKEIYTVSGTIASIAHTSPRRILTVFNQSEFREGLRSYGLEDMTWEGPPAISSYLLWVAQRRGIPGVSLWSEIPLYLAATEDHEAIKRSLSFLDKRFNLELDLGEFNLKIKRQNEKLARLREENPEVNKSIEMLERGLSLSENEQVKLAEQVSELFKKGQADL
ncbi:hypothetical protein ES703_110824 [subsurface metagenome]